MARSSICSTVNSNPRAWSTLVAVTENLAEFQAKQLTVCVLPNDGDRQLLGSAGISTSAPNLQHFADFRVLKRNAPDLYEQPSKWKISLDEAMQILEGPQAGRWQFMSLDRYGYGAAKGSFGRVTRRGLAACTAHRLTSPKNLSLR
jgi:hypothetical protein